MDPPLTMETQQQRASLFQPYNATSMSAHDDNGDADQPPHKQRKRHPTSQPITIKATGDLVDTYRKANPSFVYVSEVQNPRRVLTKDARPSGNHGYDNKSCDLILTVGDVLRGSSGGHRFRVLDMLGQGTFGQVVKCKAEWAHDTEESSTSIETLRMSDVPKHLRKPPTNSSMVAVKIVKNKPAYFNQAKVEIKILSKINEELGIGTNPGDPGYSLIRLLYDFEYHNHLCMVFELMSINLYELIKHQDFRGLAFNRVRSFCHQLLDALECLFKLGVIHCDLKPENILLENIADTMEPRIKLIDLGSACYHDHVAFTYIQSRFYRAPEVIIGVKYSSPIDLWSLGCVAVELFMGLPVFPGVSGHNQLARIIEMLGMPPTWMLDEGKKTETYFVQVPNKEPVGDLEFDMKEDYFSTNRRLSIASVEEPHHKKRSEPATNWKIKSANVWAVENGLRDGPEKTKRYVKEKTLPGVILNCEAKRRPKNEPVENIPREDLICFVDFCSGLLRLDPNTRWTAAQANKHPFITQAAWHGPYVPASPSPEPEEPLEDLYFGERRMSEAVSDLDMDLDLDEEDEEAIQKEAQRRVKPKAAPLAIATATTSSATAPALGVYSSSASGKSSGLSSSQQRYKRKLSEANVGGSSPGTTVGSLSSVLGSPIMRPDVPYPLAHQSRWSDLSLLASPTVGPMAVQYHNILPPLDQMGSPSSQGGSSFKQVAYGSSLPTHSFLSGDGEGIHGYRRLDSQNPPAPPMTSSSGSAANWPFQGIIGNIPMDQHTFEQLMRQQMHDEYMRHLQSMQPMPMPMQQQQLPAAMNQSGVRRRAESESQELYHGERWSDLSAGRNPQLPASTSESRRRAESESHDLLQGRKWIDISASSNPTGLLGATHTTEARRRAESDTLGLSHGERWSDVSGAHDQLGSQSTNQVDASPPEAGTQADTDSHEFFPGRWSDLSASVNVENTLAKWTPFDKEETKNERSRSFDKEERKSSSS